MSLPRQAQLQAEEAERLQAEISGEPAVEDGANQTPSEAPDDSGQPVAQPEPLVTQAPEATPEPPKADEEQTWHNRFKTLQGKYNAEVPRLTTELRDLKGQLNTAIAKLDSFTEAKTAPPPAKLVTDKDVEVFGSDLIDVIDRKAREVAQTAFDSGMDVLKTENSKLREQLTGVTDRQASSDQRGYFSELAQAVPDWEAVNVDDGFLEWLAEVDTLSGQPRQDYLNRAFANLDTQRTVALFNAYKQTTGTPVPAADAVDPKAQLQRQIAPGTSKAAAAAPSSGTKLWTMNEIDQFYRSITQGAFRDNEPERVRIEAEIDQAVAEGRLR